MAEDWRRAIDRGKLVGAAMVDLSKAFDMVQHDILLKKLVKYGVWGDELLWFSSYLQLSEHCQKVCLEQQKSDWVEIRRGVPQGSILGPRRMNDFPTVTNQTSVRQYADDTTRYHAADTVEELGTVLEGDLNRLAD